MNNLCEAIDDLHGLCDYQAERQYTTPEGHTRRLCERHYVQVWQVIQFAALVREYRTIVKLQEEQA